MLYITTREKYDAFTVARTLASDRGPEGGLYLPFKMPRFTASDLAALKEKTFGQTVADMLALFFGVRLSAWDIEFCIGRYPIRVAPMSQKVLVAECWRNLDGSYEKMERQIAARIVGSSAKDVNITSWMRVAIRICILVAVYGELQRLGFGDTVDVSVPEEDFSLCAALVYCRQMGLPVGNIVCACKVGSDVWELLHNGVLRASALDNVPELERLLFATLGFDMANASYAGRQFTPDLRDEIRKGIYAAVVSVERMTAAIPNVYRTTSYIMEPGVAAAYSGLQDYRARTGESRIALLLADRNPGEAPRKIADALGITTDQLKELLG